VAAREPPCAIGRRTLVVHSCFTPEAFIADGEIALQLTQRRATAARARRCIAPALRN